MKNYIRKKAKDERTANKKKIYIIYRLIALKIVTLEILSKFLSKMFISYFVISFL